ncbi:uncharacterized protein LOC127979498 [Carassius gibelio]|uniref:uncharacterized protein LOC127979498 n=1 Tax=Carassius gibelio TaxID=101364 RepID=UPI002278F03C|nr:uncharacterized protein LOC127979498 [Carassius gibelio]
MQRARADMMLVRRKYKRYSKHKMTYLGLIAYIIENAPEKKLTFYELMKAVAIFVDGDRKGLENNIRVCLSSNSCFVKVPVNPECPNARRNFWKVDESKFTPKILRRHFSALRDVLPDSYESMEMSSVKNETENRTSFKRPEAEKKFISSFSIECLLQRESSAPMRNTPVLSETRNLENQFVGLADGHPVWAFKRKTCDWPHQTSYADFSRSYSPFYFPAHSLGQMNDGCFPSSGSSKRMFSFSNLSYCSAPESIRQFTSNVNWAYM